ncbi:MAG: CD225/dispanin family protein [Thermodesulfobacteriota bacterium]
MFCSKCGSQNPDGAVVCSACGNPLQTLSATRPSGPQDVSEIKSHLVWSILATLFCCLPFGIVAIVYSSRVSKKLAEGDLAGAVQDSKNAKLWCLLSLTGIVVYIFLFGIVAAIAIPQFVAYRSRAMDALAKAELYNLEMAQEAYYTDKAAYADNLEALSEYYTPNPQVIIEIESADQEGWRATAWHQDSRNRFTYDSRAGGLLE